LIYYSEYFDILDQKFFQYELRQGISHPDIRKAIFQTLNHQSPKSSVMFRADVKDFKSTNLKPQKFDPEVKRKIARNDSSDHKTLNYESLGRIRGAYYTALQSQLYTRDMIGRIAKGDFNGTLDKNTKYDLGDDSKEVYANLVPYEM